VPNPPRAVAVAGAFLSQPLSLTSIHLALLLKLNCGSKDPKITQFDMISLRPFRRALTGNLIRRGYSTHLKEVPASDPPKPVTPASNISKTNETPTSSMGSHGQALVESEAEAKEMRAMQAPNRKEIWSRSQKPREQAMVGPRFEQMILQDQVHSFSGGI
jgi:hypothetical protein